MCAAEEGGREPEQARSRSRRIDQSTAMELPIQVYRWVICMHVGIIDRWNYSARCSSCVYGSKREHSIARQRRPLKYHLLSGKCPSACSCRTTHKHIDRPRIRIDRPLSIQACVRCFTSRLDHEQDPVLYSSCYAADHRLSRRRSRAPPCSRSCPPCRACRRSGRPWRARGRQSPRQTASRAP